jgi:hypothetical protein
LQQHNEEWKHFVLSSSFCSLKNHEKNERRLRT